MNMTDDPSAAKTLDAIREGGGNVLLMLRHRINEATSELDKGGFVGAASRLEEARGLCAMLAQAQSYLGVAHTGRMVRTRDLEVGMTLTQLGEVTSVEQASCEHDSCPGHYLVQIGDNAPLLLDGDNSVYVEVASATGNG